MTLATANQTTKNETKASKKLTYAEALEAAKAAQALLDQFSEEEKEAELKSAEKTFVDAIQNAKTSLFAVLKLAGWTDSDSNDRLETLVAEEFQLNLLSGQETTRGRKKMPEGVRKARSTKEEMDKIRAEAKEAEADLLKVAKSLPKEFGVADLKAKSALEDKVFSFAWGALLEAGKAKKNGDPKAKGKGVTYSVL